MGRRVFITGSTDGLGLAAAEHLIEHGHSVLLHARSEERAASFAPLATRALGVVIGDLSDAAGTRALADRVNRFGRMDAIIHNAGVYAQATRGKTREGHAVTFAVNVLAPYLLTALIERPARLIYMSSGMHRGGDASLHDIDWTERAWNASRAYSESKFYVTALALAVARRWPDVVSTAVDPGWVPTKMGGPSAPDSLALGRATQAWLAVSDDAAALVSGRYWHHRRNEEPAGDVRDTAFQERLIARLVEITQVTLSGVPQAER